MTIFGGSLSSLFFLFFCFFAYCVSCASRVWTHGSCIIDRLSESLFTASKIFGEFSFFEDCETGIVEGVTYISFVTEASWSIKSPTKNRLTGKHKSTQYKRSLYVNRSDVSTTTSVLTPIRRLGTVISDDMTAPSSPALSMT